MGRQAMTANEAAGVRLDQWSRSSRWRAIGVGAVAIGLAVTATFAGGDVDDEVLICTPCVGDFNGDGVVDGADLGLLLSAWGPCKPGTACVFDLNGDGVVDGADLGLMLNGWGECPQFDYPEPPENPEAYQIALEIIGAGGPLLPPPELVDRVAQDLAAIRAATPLLADQPHTPAFQWDFLILSRNQDVDPSSYDCLNAFYQASVWAELEALQLTILQFPGALNAPALAQIYAASPHVNTAEPSGIFGGENFWIPTVQGGVDGTWHWFVDDGFQDCFDGCDCHYFYEFSVTADGEVTLLDFWTWGLPWCQWPF